ncbi:hypothetical protein HRR86_008166 [Exophiala dermatitidis]|nr:hypothetical protein HRR86_008166 [Exophiala dermatitidis]
MVQGMSLRRMASSRKTKMIEISRTWFGGHYCSSRLMNTRPSSHGVEKSRSYLAHFMLLFTPLLSAPSSNTLARADGIDHDEKVLMKTMPFDINDLVGIAPTKVVQIDHNNV